MQVLINGKDIMIHENLHDHVTETLNHHVKKYFANAIDANVVFSREGQQYIKVDIFVHAARGLNLQSKAVDSDARFTFDQAIEKLSKQLRRYKRRIKDDKSEKTFEQLEYITVPQYVLKQEIHENDELPESGRPAIIAEMVAEIATLSVEEAVMRMDLADSNAMMFVNKGNGSFNVVYHRSDGHIGWIDPGNILPNTINNVSKEK